MSILDVYAGEVNETETREIITESLKKAGWQLYKDMRYEYKITDGRVHINEDDEAVREKALYADYLLFAPNGRPLAVVEAKREGKLEGTGIQQAIKYATLLDAPFAFSSNGKSFEFYCLATAQEESYEMGAFPSQKELWERFCTNQNYSGDMTKLHPYIDSKYLVYTINSPYGIECKSLLATGQIIVHISNDKLASIQIPLPPLSIQHRIAQKIEEVFTAIDKLK